MAAETPSNTLVRLVRLALLLSVVPCIRGCDDARGLSQTAGFPLPFTERTNTDPLFRAIDWGTMGIDALCLAAAAAVILMRFPSVAMRVSTARVAVVLSAYAVFNVVVGWVVFFPLLIPALGLNMLVDIDLAAYMDVASRVLLVGIVMMAAAPLEGGQGSA